MHIFVLINLFVIMKLTRTKSNLSSINLSYVFLLFIAGFSCRIIPRDIITFSEIPWKAISVNIENGGFLRSIILSLTLYKIWKTRQSRSLRSYWCDYWLVFHRKYCRIINSITGSVAPIISFGSGKIHDKQLKMISLLAEPKSIAFTNDARKRFWDMDWNVVLLLQVKGLNTH